MSTSQIQQTARSLSEGFARLIALLLRIPLLKRLFRDLKAYYRDRTAPPHDQTAILISIAIGGLLVGAAGILAFLQILLPLLAVGLLSLLGILFLVPLLFYAVPLLFGFYVRELASIIHADHNHTLLHDPFRPDRPAFRDQFSMSVDGAKFGALPFLYALAVGAVWYYIIGLLDIVLNNIPEATRYAAGPAALIGLAGWVVLPAFLARFADRGTLGAAVANPLRFIKNVPLTSAYLPHWAIGTGVIAVSAVVVALIYWFSPLLVVGVGLPVVFVATVQGMGHYALAYQAASPQRDPIVDRDRTIPDDAYLIPFREGRLATPSRDRSILALGETGSGKTEAIKLLAYQFANDPTDPFVVFDYKEDYREFFGSPIVADGGATTADADADDPLTDSDTDEQPSENLVVLSLEGSTHTWNLFAEAESEADLEELGRTLFAQQESGASDPFFPTAARQCFVGILKYIWRDDSIENPTNADLLRYFESSNLDQIHDDLREHPDLQGIAKTLDPDAPRMSGAVYGQIQVVISEVFKGDFRECGDFSIREYMRDPQGRTLLLDFPTDRGETIKPIFRLFVDWSIRFGLADPDRSAYYILDEFQTIPGLERLQRLVNVGQARNAYAILGLQSKSQLFSTYGESDGEAILAGLAQEILLRPGDQPSVDHIRARLGRYQRKHLSQGPTSHVIRTLTGQETTFNQVSIREEHYISESELQQFSPGEAIVIEPTGWQRGHLYMLNEARPALDRVHAGTMEAGDQEADRPDPDGAQR